MHGGEKRVSRQAGKYWKKGFRRGKGGPDNAKCEYRGVRQRTWGKWVVEIREPTSKARLWLGSFSTAEKAARAYDDKSRELYGPHAFLNLPNAPATTSDDPRDTSQDHNAPHTERSNPSPPGQFDYARYNDPFLSNFEDPLGRAFQQKIYLDGSTGPAPAPVLKPCPVNSLILNSSKIDNIFQWTAPPPPPLEESDNTGCSASARGGWEDADTAASLFTLDDFQPLSSAQPGSVDPLGLNSSKIETIFPWIGPPLPPLEESDNTGCLASARGGWEDADTASGLFNLDDFQPL